MLPCPSCGGDARVPAGTYTVVNNALHHLEGKTLKRVQVDLLRRYRDGLLAQKKSADAVIPDEVIDAVTAIAPMLGASIKLLKDGKGSWIFLILLLHLILSRCDAGGNGGSVTIFDEKRTEVTQTTNVTKVTNVTNVTNVYQITSPTFAFTPPTLSYDVNKAAKNNDPKGTDTTGKSPHSKKK